MNDGEMRTGSGREAAVVDFPRVPPATVPERVGEHTVESRQDAAPSAGLLGVLSRLPAWMPMAAILVLAVFVRVYKINAVGYNSDEAVYGGQGASLADYAPLEPYFPTFRAHPLLFQTLLAVGYHLDIGEIFGRLASAALGVATVLVTYKLGRLLFGQRSGLIAALLLALMPYHVIVTRQVLLDGPMVFFATLSLYLLAQYSLTQRPAWLYAAGAGLGLTALAKEGSLVLLGSVYAFLALTPEIRTKIRHIVVAAGFLAVIFASFPLSLRLAGSERTGGNYLAWQLFRRPNHEWTFYPTTVPIAIGVLVVLVAIAGLWLRRRGWTWRETLLLSWILVPVAFFQLWPVKGFQYLLPIAPAVAILAARAIDQAAHAVDGPRAFLRVLRSRRFVAVATAVLALSVAIPTWQKIQPPRGDSFLAGSGGVPGGRETGRWIAEHVPENARILALGPSMANIISFYGHRKAYGLSVSPNPLNRNPSYEPLPNPDRLIRDNELQYIVWDSFSAKRSTFFSERLLRYADRYNGRAIYSYTVPAKTRDGKTTRKPVIIVYEVRP